MILKCCISWLIVPCNHTCAEDEIRCKASCKCIHESEVCDGMDDCPHGTDERGCGGESENHVDWCIEKQFDEESGITLNVE